MRCSFRNLRVPSLISLALVISCLLGSVSVFAQETSFPHGKLELLSENSAIVRGATFTVGLHFQLDRGWHIYWVNPGDSGEPPRVTWQLPPGLKAGEIEWPAPEKMGAPPIVNFVYDGDVLLLVPIHTAAAIPVAQTIKLDALVKLLLCNDQMCVPGEAEVALSVPIKRDAQTQAPDGKVEALFTAARARLPRPAPSGWKFSARDGKDAFLLDVNAGKRIESGFFFPLQESQVDDSAPQNPAPSPSGLKLTLHKSDQFVKPISHLKGVLALPGGEAYLVDVLVTPSLARRAAGSPH